MAHLSIPVSSDFLIDVDVRESDIYTRAVFLKFEHHITPENIRSVNEIFMSPEHLELLGRFLISQAEEIKSIQAHREVV